MLGRNQASQLGGTGVGEQGRAEFAKDLPQIYPHHQNI